MIICDKQCNFVALYSLPSQNQDEFDSFSKHFEITLDRLALNNPFMFVVIRELNLTSKNEHPLDRTTYEGNMIETITSNFDLHQLVHDPTHILEKSLCIDLIFTSQLNMMVNLGVHSSLHANFHYQVLFAKFYLEIYYSPQYQCEAWHYREADAIFIRQVIHEFSWKRVLSNLNIDKQVTVLNRTILNILNNFISHETILCDDKDLLWFNKKIKSLIQEGAL